jgi:2-amino-4-hydroxy-6-hydroxymethyldihydropteridine diphosphokinase
MALVYILLGSNIENKMTNLENAKIEILKTDIQFTRASFVYETEPWGFTNPENFLNQVLEINTPLKPDQLLRRFQFIEKHSGRIKKKKGYESRIIDIDILLYENEVIQQEDITVPHPLLHLRRFVLVPLCEIAPLVVHPILKKDIRGLLKDCKDKGKVWLNKKLI